MSSVPALAQVARGMIQREKNRLGCPQAARDTVARRIKIGAGSLSNLIRERIKTVSADLRSLESALATACKAIERMK